MRCRRWTAVVVLLVASTSAFLDGSQNGALDSKPPVKVSVKVQEAPVAQVHEERQVADNKMKRPVHTGVSVVPQHIAGPLPHHALPADIREEPRYATQVHASPPQGAATNADTPQQQAKEEEGVAQLHPSSESLHDAVAWATNHLRDADLEVARAEAEAGNIQLDAKKAAHLPNTAPFRTARSSLFCPRSCAQLSPIVGGDRGSEGPRC